MRVTLTPQQLQSLIRFAEDEHAHPDLEAVEALNVLNAAVQHRVAKMLGGQLKRNATLTERLDRYREREQRRIDTGELPGTGLTSLEVANALLYQLQKNGSQKISVGKTILILYRIYASWLYSAKERLFDEHPTTTSYGPQFTDAYLALKKRNLYERVPYEAWASLREKNYSVAGVIQNYATKYGPVPYEEIQEKLLKSLPYLNASKENNNGKWGKIISDADIYAWKKSTREKTGAGKTKE